MHPVLARAVVTELPGEGQPLLREDFLSSGAVGHSGLIVTIEGACLRSRACVLVLRYDCKQVSVARVSELSDASLLRVALQTWQFFARRG